MTTKLPDGNLPNDSTEDKIRPSLIQRGEAGDTALEIYHEELLPKGSVPMTADEINRETIKRFKGYKYGKYVLKAQVARVHENPVRPERSRSSGYRPKRS
jgi:hypothetical protein